MWLFFDEPLAASTARNLATHLLTETLERRPDIGMDSYDRFFPNQDTMPRGGFGNLIALPLQGRPRQSGYSLFVDDHFVPYPDQWQFLSRVKKIGRRRAEQIVDNAAKKGRIVGVRWVPSESGEDSPWDLPPSRQRKQPPIVDPLPPELELVVGDQVYLAKEGLPPALRSRLASLAAFQNPGFFKAQAMRLPTYDKPRIIACAEDHPHHLSLPRGCLEDVRRMLSSLNVKTTIRDERNTGMPLDVHFLGQLRIEQQAAVEAMKKHDCGVLAATTAFGKTVVASWLIAERKVNTLVIVHRRQLLEQWVARLSRFLEIPTTSIGRIGSGRRKPTGQLDVALVQSLVRQGAVDDCVAGYGHVVVDECHHVAARSFEEVGAVPKQNILRGFPPRWSAKMVCIPLFSCNVGQSVIAWTPKSTRRRAPLIMWFMFALRRFV